MIRPYYASRLFWLGIPGLLFLLWAWWHSNFFHQRLFLPGGSHVNSTQGKVLWFSSQSDVLHDFRLDFRTGEVSMASGEGPPRFLFSTYWVEDWTFDTTKVPADDQAWFPAPRWQARDINRDTYYRLLSVPYWLLTGGYAAAWMGGVAGWQRRKAILLKAAASPPP